MCGIVGILNLDGHPADEIEVRAMMEAVKHRGPDGEGLYLDGALGLGHRRLAILDLSEAGKQPMPYAAGRYWITYNGEIYNFLELRDELESCGHEFVSDSDTEVILAAYTQWGEACQLRLNGMWAFAIWDREERLLLVHPVNGEVPPVKGRPWKLPHYANRGKTSSSRGELASARSCFSTVRTALGKLRITGLLARFDVARSFPQFPRPLLLQPTIWTSERGADLGSGRCQPRPHLPIYRMTPSFPVSRSLRRQTPVLPPRPSSLRFCFGNEGLSGLGLVSCRL